MSADPAGCSRMTIPASPEPQRGPYPYPVPVSPATLRWAQEHSGRDVETLARCFPKYREWEASTVKPAYRQFWDFARATYTPFGVLSSHEPLNDELDIADFRTMTGRQPRKPSPHLPDTVYMCQHRQNWYHEYAFEQEHDPVKLVGSPRLDDDLAQEDIATHDRPLQGQHPGRPPTAPRHRNACRTSGSETPTTTNECEYRPVRTPAATSCGRRWLNGRTVLPRPDRRYAGGTEPAHGRTYGRLPVKKQATFDKIMA